MRNVFKEINCVFLTKIGLVFGLCSIFARCSLGYRSNSARLCSKSNKKSCSKNDLCSLGFARARRCSKLFPLELGSARKSFFVISLALGSARKFFRWARLSSYPTLSPTDTYQTQIDNLSFLEEIHKSAEHKTTTKSATKKRSCYERIIALGCTSRLSCVLRSWFQTRRDLELFSIFWDETAFLVLSHGEYVKTKKFRALMDDDWVRNGSFLANFGLYAFIWIWGVLPTVWICSMCLFSWPMNYLHIIINIITKWVNQSLFYTSIISNV